MASDRIATREARAPANQPVSVARLCSRLIAVAAALIATQSAVAPAQAAGHHHRWALRVIASTSCPDGTLLPTQANIVRVEAATLCLVNVQRARRGQRALRRNADLTRSATAHSHDMVSENYFDHVSPAGETPLGRILASGYLPRRAAYVVGENIAVGMVQLATPAAIVAAWMRSPDHRANILTRDFRDSGFGIVAQLPSRYAHGLLGATYTQQFGVIAR